MGHWKNEKTKDADDGKEGEDGWEQPWEKDVLAQWWRGKCHVEKGATVRES